MKRSNLLYLIVGMLICTLLCSCSAAPKGTPSAGKFGETAAQGEPDGTSSPTTEVQNTEPEAGAETSKAEEPDAAALESVYQELIGSIHALILAENLETDLALAEEALNGILDAGYSRTAEETLEYVGYTFADLNADGMPELIVGGIGEKRDGKAFGRDIYAVYTCVQEEIYCVCSGWARSYVGWLGENLFYYSGSAGAAYTLVGEYELLPNATEWSCINLYFTEEDGIYYNQTGSCDREDAELLDMTWDELWELDNVLRANVLEFELTPFSTCT